jgi:hypothetical protein
MWFEIAEFKWFLKNFQVLARWHRIVKTTKIYIFVK